MNKDFLTNIMNENVAILKKRSIKVRPLEQLKHIVVEVVEATSCYNNAFMCEEDWERLEIELADIVISTLTLMNNLEIDPTDALEKATEKNRKRVENEKNI